MVRKKILGVACILLIITACQTKDKTEELAFVAENISYVTEQMDNMIASLPDLDTAAVGKIVPATYEPSQDKVYTCHPYSWTIGFFPGSLWKVYELTGDTIWKDRAARLTKRLEYLKTFTGNHDLGFMVGCSFGNGYRLAPDEYYRDVLIESARSLSTRFLPRIQVIKSWNYRKAWNGETEWFCPVIIDNMMNLEMLCEASKLSGDSCFTDIAVTHANTTVKNHFREDYSTYHVVDYDTISGAIKDQATCQGYSDNSTWARGQAWAVYGYTMMYRETGKPEYLEVAKGAADWFITHLPEDFMPLWDFNVGQEGYTPEGKSKAVKNKVPYKDASAASITCSALFELGDLSRESKYTDAAIKMLHRLASPDFRAPLGENGNFLLMHSVGSLPHGGSIDVPLDYADYYFLEALVRYRDYLTK